ncbi:hypothetical protein BDD12DRAFT_804674 [Trichophaea hybrida]|nr:hypothetical protein BDD12DRAFT_804674 [Trichophaea hybrida]
MLPLRHNHRQRTARTRDTTNEYRLCNKKNKKFGIFESENVGIKGCTKCIGMLFCKSHWETFQGHDPDCVDEAELRVHRKFDPNEYRPIRALLSSANETKRFADILSTDTEKDLNDEQFPRLVSFVGLTGVGKSFLIKSLMTLHGGDEKSVQMPIPAALKSAGTATSYNVHMYGDERTLRETCPLFYVDSEGLEGGSNPTAARLVKASVQELQSKNKGKTRSNTNSTTIHYDELT